jgi:HEAT repeat protein
MRLVDSLASGASPDRDLARVKYIAEEDFVSVELTKVLQRSVDVHQREILSYALSILASHAAEVPLLHLLTDDNAAVRLNAAQGLGRIPAKSWRPLVPLLKDASSGVRAAAGRALGSMKAGRAAPALLAAARVEGEPEVRATLLTAAGDTGDRGAAAALAPFLTVSSETTRLGAARGLCHLGAPQGLAFAEKRLSSTEKLERRSGLDLLEGAPLRVAAPLLRPLLKDADVAIAAKAARMLYQGGDKVMLDWLVLASFHAAPDQKDAYERELELLQLQDDQRKAILARAGALQ